MFIGPIRNFNQDFFLGRWTVSRVIAQDISQSFCISCRTFPHLKLSRSGVFGLSLLSFRIHLRFVVHLDYLCTFLQEAPPQMFDPFSAIATFTSICASSLLAWTVHCLPGAVTPRYMVTDSSFILVMIMGWYQTHLKMTYENWENYYR